MKSANKTRFEYIDRNRKGSLVLIPGWATDYRIFDMLDLEFNYIVPVSFLSWGFTEDLADFLVKKGIRKLSLFGHSLGGFIAVEFASRYPDLIDELILVGIRKRYSSKEIGETERNLKKNRKAYLYKFYTQSIPGKEEIKYFKDTLLKDYIEGMDLDYLLSALTYLGGSEIKIDPGGLLDPRGLRGVNNIKIIHGEDDRVAPIKEAIEIKNNLEDARLITIKDAGHIPFFRKDFSQEII